MKSRNIEFGQPEINTSQKYYCVEHFQSRCVGPRDRVSLLGTLSSQPKTTSTGRLITSPPAIPLIWPGSRIYGFNDSGATWYTEMCTGRPQSTGLHHFRSRYFTQLIYQLVSPPFENSLVARVKRVFTRTDLACPVNVPHNIIFFVSNSVCP